MFKRLAVILAWVLATLGTASLTYAAVSRVGPDAADRPGVPVASQEIADRVAANAATTTPTTLAAPTTVPTVIPDATTTTLPVSTTTGPVSTTSTTAGGTTTIPTTTGSSTAYRTTPGGTVGVSVSGSAVTLLSAQPAPGYATDVEDDGPEQVEVEFDGESAEYTVRARIVDGVLTWTVSGGEEEDGGSGDG